MIRFSSFLVLLMLFCKIGFAYQAGFRSITFTDPARSNRSIPCDVYYPANQAGNEVPLAQGEFPHLVFGHGFLMATSAYEPIASALAEQGFVVFLPRTETGLFPNHTNFARDLAFVAEDALLKATNDPAFFFYESLNGRFAIGGHSMGGGCTYLSYQYLTSPANSLFTFAAAETNPSAVNQMGAIPAPNLLLAGSLDCVTPPADHQIPMYQAQHPDACKNYVEITGGYHCQFNTSNFNCNLGEGSCQPAGGISREAQIQLTLDLLIPWLQAWLFPDCDAWQAFEALIEDDMGFTHERICELEDLGNPMIAYSGGLELCPGESLVLEAVPGIGQITWSTGHIGVELEVIASGVYSYTASNGVCSAMSEELEVVFVQEIFPEVQWTGEQVICPGTSIELHAFPGIGQIQWSNGQNSSSIFVFETGFYSFTEELSNCLFYSDTIYIEVSSSIVPQVFAAGPTELCEGDSVLLYAFPETAGITWSDGSQTPEIVVSETGLYFYEILYENCLFLSDSIFVQVSSAGDLYVNYSAAPFICPGEMLTLSATALAGEISWSTGASSNSIDVSEAGDYFYQVTLNGCFFYSDTLQVDVAPAIEVHVQLTDSLICPGSTVLLESGQSGGVVVWSNQIEGFTQEVVSGGMYSFVLDSLGCQYFSDTVMLVEGPTIELSIISDGAMSICDGDSIVFLADPVGLDIVWSDGSFGDSLVVFLGGAYYFTLDSMTCSYSSDTIEIVFVAQPEVALIVEGEQPVCPGDSVLLLVEGAAGSIIWDESIWADSLWVYNSGTYVYRVVVEGCDFGGESVIVDFYPDWSPGEINGFDTIEPSKVYTYDVNGEPDWEYVWEVDGADILQGQGTNAINVLTPADLSDSVYVQVYVDDLLCKSVSLGKWLYRDQVISTKDESTNAESVKLTDMGSKWLIEFDGGILPEQMTIIATSGQQVLGSRINSPVMEIDVNNLLPGMYFLIFSGVQIKPFVVKSIRK